MTDPLAEIAAVMKMIQADCITDAQSLDRTPFTPQGIGKQ